MSIDMSQFYQVFFEEAQEHLASMESLLLGVDINDPDAEQLNAVFRAAHSIKGSAGTFGFTDLAEVTHILENLLDRIRKGELKLQSVMIDAFLDAGDILKVLLAAHRGEGEADPAAVAAICKRLSELTVSPGSAVAASPAAPTASAAPPAAGEHDVSFVIDFEGEEANAAIDNLVQDMSQRWATTLVARPQNAGEPYRLRVAADADLDMLREMIEFVARSDSIRIGSTGAVANADAADGSYGFFEDAPAQTAAAAPASSKDSADGAYGFFDDLPVPPAGPTLSATAGSEGDGFGFFVDVPAPAAQAPQAPVAAAAPSATVTPIQPAAERRAAPRAGQAKPAATGGGETSIRVDVDKVDQLINLIGELVITQAMLAQSAAELDPVKYERLHNGLGQLERNTRDMQESVMSIRMLPISVVFSRFPRVVRDLSQKLGKKVELKTIGEGTELDKSLIERISDPLTHLVRNSLDHGVEMPADRAAKGKPETGTITLKAYHQSGNIVIEVGDDGAGLSRQKILGKAKERGLPHSDQMSDGEVWMLIFEAGFSTADVITEVSGRGVGMDVVRRNIAAMGGRVEIESMLGIGTRMTVRLPLTLAILDGMSVAAGDDTYIIPLGYVVESLQAEPSMIKSVSGVERLIQVRGEYLPVIALYEVFGIKNAVRQMNKGIMVIVETDGTKAALFIDALLGQHQVVIKSLEANYRKVQGVSGATIMGDGHVALILDVAALVQMAKNLVAHAPLAA
jgi:two-component system chemotaxis sensor kinase CheA